MDFIDLHIHTYYSDGNCSPAKMVEMADNIGLVGISITDHDNISGLKEAEEKCLEKNIKFVSGVELSTSYNNEEFHILVYNLKNSDKKIIELNEYAKNIRKESVLEMIKKLNKNGVNISIIEYNEECNKYKPEHGGWPLLNLLKRKEYVKGPKDYFEKYFSPNSCCYVPFDFKRTEDIISIIRGIGYLPVLAHPGSYKKNKFNKKMLFKFIDNGLSGIEVYSIYHSEDFKNELIEIANNNNLIITGGSDCHGDENAIVKRPIGGANVPAYLLPKLINFNLL